MRGDESNCIITTMARRRELKSIASGIALHCVSRNNDLGGYWGLGVLYLTAQKMGVDQLRIDIMSDHELPEALALFRHNFRDHYGNEKYRISHFIEGFIVEYKFDPQSGTPFTGRMAQAICSVHILDDLGIFRTAMATSYCYPHDPLREHKSMR